MPDALCSHAPLFTPARNCWRVARSRRATMVVDAARYFELAASAIRQARHSVLLLAWDFVPETELRPGATPEERITIGELFREVTARRPNLDVRVLVWDKAAYFALKRGQRPGSQGKAGGSQIDIQFDSVHPPFACHHQKIMVVDDALAFCGGIDFADNRWDTRDHRGKDARRTSTTGEAFDPRHDVMMAVDGDGAAVLGQLARERWHRATGERLAAPPAGADPWPGNLVPDLRDVDVAISRTVPLWRDQPETREVEQLYLDAIAVARSSIYLESQYFASVRIAGALARRLAEPNGPEVVAIVPEAAPTWIEQQGMDSARGRLISQIRRADRFGRFRIYAPWSAGQPVIVHSKLMVVDGRFVRIGSSNLSERSLGVDSECDLSVEAAPGRTDVQAAIRRFRNGLLAEHLGVEPWEVSAAVAGRGSIIQAIDALNHHASRRLRPISGDADQGLVPRLIHDTISDPCRPWGLAGAGSRPAWLGLSVILAAAAMGLWFTIRSMRRKH